ncbi:Uncharacterised protein [Clostridium perfringens]|uniref:Uncharacterized protein n=1 Tax=Clostridium perfringens TaxID=1502 RepID=A0A2X3CJV1_CLOPF|nr:hypothetical protein [Clostridium perfringens]SQC08795.1 Uncharacterised protein [Clostridium perfringens]
MNDELRKEMLKRLEQMRLSKKDIFIRERTYTNLLKVNLIIIS